MENVDRARRPLVGELMPGGWVRLDPAAAGGNCVVVFSEPAGRPGPIDPAALEAAARTALPPPTVPKARDGYNRKARRKAKALARRGRG